LKTFKEFLADSTPNYEWLSFSVDHYQVHILFECISGEVLTEAKHRGLPLGGEYSAQLHKAHSPVGQDHIHVYAKNNQLFALNSDGSAHDASHGTHIPKRVAKAIEGKFPQIMLPANLYIESAPMDVSKAARLQLLLG
jgi:hypothetical protein